MVPTYIFLCSNIALLMIKFLSNTKQYNISLVVSFFSMRIHCTLSSKSPCVFQRMPAIWERNLRSRFCRHWNDFKKQYLGSLLVANSRKDLVSLGMNTILIFCFYLLPLLLQKRDHHVFLYVSFVLWIESLDHFNNLP